MWGAELVDDIEAIPTEEINEMEAASRREIEWRVVFFQKRKAYRVCFERSNKLRVKEENPRYLAREA